MKKVRRMLAGVLAAVVVLCSAETMTFANDFVGIESETVAEIENSTEVVSETETVDEIVAEIESNYETVAESEEEQETVVNDESSTESETADTDDSINQDNLSDLISKIETEEANIDYSVDSFRTGEPVVASDDFALMSDYADDGSTVIDYDAFTASSDLHVDYHSQEDIINYIRAHRNAISFKTTYEELPVTTQDDTNSYRPGKLSRETQNNAVELLNIFRYIAGIPYDVKIDSDYEELAQAACLVNAANSKMSHYPSRPDGIDDDLYEMGYYGASHSNIGCSSGGMYDGLCYMIKYGWMADEDTGNISRVGHRRWCLNPTMQYTGFGEVNNGAGYWKDMTAMYAFDNTDFQHKSPYTRVAWPAQNTPKEFFPDDYPWSISMGWPVDETSVKVTLTNLNDGKVYNFTSEESDGAFYVENSYYGQQGCIIFRPNGGTTGTNYNVAITGICNNASFDINYNVNFFDISEAFVVDIENKFPKSYFIAVNSGTKHKSVFTPSRTGNYTFESENSTYYTGISIQDANGNVIASDESYYYDNSFEYKITANLQAGQTYYIYSSVLWNNGGTYTLKVTTDLPVTLDTPVLTGATVVDGGVSVTWKAVDGATKYRVFKKAEGGSWAKVADTTGTSWKVTGLTGGTKYYFTVRCISEDGSTYISGYDSKGKTVTYTLSTPKLTSVSNVDGGVQVNWNKVTGAAKYRVYKKTAGGTWAKVADTTGTSLKVTGLKAGTKYYFTVRCFTSDGKTFTSGYDATGLSITYYLSTPKLSSVSNVDGGVKVTWGAVTGASKYRVYKKTDGGSWTKVGESTGTSLKVTGLTAGTKYSFTVRCFSNDGKTIESGYDGTGKSIIYYLATPTLTSAVSDKEGVLVKWNAVNGAAQYAVYRKVEGGSWTRIATTKDTSYKFKNLTSGKKYTFTVRCLSADGKVMTSDYDKTGLTVTWKK